jgi:hypothetical protein
MPVKITKKPGNTITFSQALKLAKAGCKNCFGRGLITKLDANRNPKPAFCDCVRRAAKGSIITKDPQPKDAPPPEPTEAKDE